MKIKHIVITRLALKWKFEETSLSWDNWLKYSVHLMDTYCRPSLKNQSTQDFTLLSFVDKSVENYGNVLFNEIIIKTTSYIRSKIIHSINVYLDTLKNENYDYVIVSRLDRDDCLHFKFLEKVRNYFSGEKKEQYLDLNNSITFSAKDKIFYDSKKYYNTSISPFVSTYEKIINGKIKCYPMAYDHGAVGKHIPGKKVEDLLAIQVIHGNNLKNRIYGKPITINQDDYGINNNSSI
jgi:hypothetical protein